MFNVKKWYATTSNDEEENKGKKTEGKKRRRFRLIHKMTSIKCERKIPEFLFFVRLFECLSKKKKTSEEIVCF